MRAKRSRLGRVGMVNGRRMVWPLLALLGLTGGFCYGYLCNERELPPHALAQAGYDWVRRQPVLRGLYHSATGQDEVDGPHQTGWGATAGTPGVAGGLTDHQSQLAAKLAALGYAQGYETAPDVQQVTYYDTTRACNGLNLYVSGHATEAMLMDMEGKVLHTWARTFREAFPDNPDRRVLASRSCFRRAHLFDNGDLLAIYHGFGMVKLDKDSNLIWANPCTAHHDLFVDQEGFIYTLTSEVTVLPGGQRQDPTKVDFITILDPNGRVVRSVSILEAFRRSSYASCLATMPESGDVFHTNTVEVLDGSLADRHRAFGKGNVLISLRNGNLIAIVDLDSEEVVWALSGQWEAQHQPTVLANGNILLFDNRGHRGGMSKVIEIDPFTQQIVWAYEGNARNGFHTFTCGSNQRLSNGNTLITESDSGRAFEVTASGQVVWMYYSPHRWGKDDQLIATLLEVVRLAPDFPTDWLDAQTGGMELADASD